MTLWKCLSRIWKWERNQSEITEMIYIRYKNGIVTILDKIRYIDILNKTRWIEILYFKRQTIWMNMPSAEHQHTVDTSVF